MAGAAKSKETTALPELRYEPLTAKRWSDLEALFGPKGACGGCWCMSWRAGHCADGAENRRLFQQRVAAGPAPGVLAYAAVAGEDGKASQQAVAWVAVAPRAEYPRMERGKVLRAIDERPAWVISCFYIARGWRRRGLQRRLIEAAVDYAKSQGATLVEAFPQEPKSEVSGTFFWTGTASAFLAAGFKEVARNTPARPVLRLELPR